jgi:sigma-E factor negative regulatory protein RseB
MNLKPFWHYALVLLALGAMESVAAQTPPAAAAPQLQSGDAPAQRSVGDWLMRMHEASRKRAYTGTFVVSSSSGNLSSARIWHVCEGNQQMERVEALTGTPRSTFRRNDQVVTFFPQARIVKTERRESLGLFPNLLKSDDSALDQFYSARQAGSGRVAGFDASVVQLTPKDKLRFGYRIWSEKKTGLVVKLQTLDIDGRVLEQAAFSDLQIDAPVKMSALVQMMGDTAGYKVIPTELVKTTPAAEGWTLRNPVAGFKSMSCYDRPMAGDGDAGGASANTLQWVFSDGLASVSLFVEAYDPRHHAKEAHLTMGATQMLTRHLSGPAGDWWVTAVGEVPLQTLKTFVENLERTK